MDRAVFWMTLCVPPSPGFALLTVQESAISGAQGMVHDDLGKVVSLVFIVV